MSPKMRVGRGATLREQLISLGIAQESYQKPMENNIDPSKGTVTRPPEGGIKSDHWFWASVSTVATKPPMEEKSEDRVKLLTPSDTQTDIGQILTDHPGISGPTFYNLLKSKGWKFVAPEFQNEADASSAQPSAILAGDKKKESSAPRRTMTFRARFLEATPRGDTAKQGLSFRCVLIQEGLGNPRDAYYYSKESLVSAIPIFEGKKIYADHPSTVEERVRPERSIRDVLGHFENISVEEVDGASRLVGDVKILPDQSFEWARAIMRHSLDYAAKYPDKDFVGLSINAGGDAKEKTMKEALSLAPDAVKVRLKQAESEGLERVRWVSKITEAVSCDLVTEAGAGGKITAMLEADKPKQEKHMDKEMDKKMESKESETKAAAAPADAKHDDEQQDVELIKKMISEYLGNEEHSEETMAAAHEAYAAAKGVGLKGEEAYKQAGMMMKMARHMSGKKKESGDEKPAPDSEKKPEGKEKPEGEPGEDEKKKGVEVSDVASKHKESNLKLLGEIAALKEKLNTIENERFLDKILKESRLPMSMTKKFREALGSKLPARREEIEAKFKLFRDGAMAAGESDIYGAIMTQPEKTGEIKSSVDFSDCLS